MGSREKMENNLRRKLVKRSSMVYIKASNSEALFFARKEALSHADRGLAALLGLAKHAVFSLDENVFMVLEKRMSAGIAEKTIGLDQ
jgi:hypothetical protein